MSLMISDECIACDACREECPSNAIEESEPIYTIEPDFCTECVGFYDEPFCVSVCPVECITADPDNIESTEELRFKYHQITSEN